MDNNVDYEIEDKRVGMDLKVVITHSLGTWDLGILGTIKISTYPVYCEQKYTNFVHS